MDAHHNHSDLEPRRLGRVFWQAVAAVAAIKAVLLVVDHAPNFFMGDSAAFIGTALTKWFPPQRSWTYGFFIRWCCLPVHSLAPLLLAQTLAGFVSCFVLGFCLCRYFRVFPTVAAGAMIFSALDPLQLLYEREVLPEAFSLTFLALVLACSFSYCWRPRLATLLVLQLLFVALISLRMQFLLPVGILLFLLPFVGNAGVIGSKQGGSSCRPWIGRAVLHLVAGIMVTVALHGAYRVAMGIKNEQPPAYTYGTSGMVLAAFAPVLRVDDAPSEPLAAAIRDDAAFPLTNRALRVRQLWAAGGLIKRIEKVEGGYYRVDAGASALLRRMVMRDPLGVFLCGARNYLDYWNLHAMPEMLAMERNAGPFDDDFTHALANHFHLDVRGYPLAAFSKTGQSRLAPWLVLLLASPLFLIAAIVCAGRQLWRQTGLLLVVDVGILAQNTILSAMPDYRYLQPLTFITLLAFGLIAQGLASSGFSLKDRDREKNCLRPPVEI